MKSLRFAFIAAILLTLVGCKGGPELCTKPEPANLWISSSWSLNPDPEGNPLPTLVRVYQLSSLGELEQASFDRMVAEPEAVLGETLIASEEVTVYPNRSAYRLFERQTGANYIVGVAVVRQPSGNSWRAIVPVPLCGESVDRPMVRFIVDGYTIRGTVVRESKPQGCTDDDPDCLRERSTGSEG